MSRRMRGACDGPIEYRPSERGTDSSADKANLWFAPPLAGNTCTRAPSTAAPHATSRTMPVAIDEITHSPSSPTSMPQRWLAAPEYGHWMTPAAGAADAPSTSRARAECTARML